MKNKYKGDIKMQAQDIWMSFITDLTQCNRFFPSDEIIPYLDSVCYFYNDKIAKGSIFYRARIIKKDQILNVFGKQKPPFYGFSCKDMYMPPRNLASEGRANANGICYLYVAYEEETALIEIRPIIDDQVCIAQIEVLSELNYIDLTAEYKYNTPFLTEEIKRKISYWFSMPVQHYEKDDYIPTQYIASYFSSKGFDAIKYESSLNPGGYNLVIINGKKAIPINSRIVRITSLGLKSVSILPQDSKNLEIKLK